MQPSALPAANFSVGPWNRSAVHQLQKEHREICVCVRISLNKFVFHFTSSAFILRYELSPIDVCASFAWVKANSDKLCFIPFSIAGSISGGCRAHAVYSWAMSRRKVRSSCRWWGGMLWMGCHAVERAICFLFADTSCSASRRRREASRLQHLCFSWLILDEQTRHHHHPHHPLPGPRACSGTNAGRNKGLSWWVGSPTPITPRYPLEASTARLREKVSRGDISQVRVLSGKVKYSEAICNTVD